MTIVQALILGIVEGLTEFIPVSSTGHLILASHFLGIEQTPFVTMFEVVIQFGALLAIVGLFASKLLRDRSMIKKIVFAFIPTAVIGLIFHESVKALFDDPRVVVWSLIIGGLALLLVEYVMRKRELRSVRPVDAVSSGQGFWVGVFQSLALVPGVSRSGATIAGGLLLGISRPAIVEFSFMLSLPTVAAASGLDLLSYGFDLSGGELALLAAGFLSAFVSALVCVKLFIKYISHHSFAAFAWYRIAVGLVLLALPL